MAPPDDIVLLRKLGTKPSVASQATPDAEMLVILLRKLGMKPSMTTITRRGRSEAANCYESSA